MPKIDQARIGVAFDMHGCPNRCRHCYLGQGSDGRLTEQDVRRGAQEFRDFLQDRTTAVRELCISTWFRDPDFSDDYRHLYELERELSDGQPPRDELLSLSLIHISEPTRPY